MLVLLPPLLLHSLLKVMAGRIRDGGPLAVTGDVKYNGHNLNEFEVVRTSAYVGQVSRSCSAPAGAHTSNFANGLAGQRTGLCTCAGASKPRPLQALKLFCWQAFTSIC